MGTGERALDVLLDCEDARRCHGHSGHVRPNERVLTLRMLSKAYAARIPPSVVRVRSYVPVHAAERLLRNSATRHTRLFEAAASCGNLELLRWGKARGYFLTDACVQEAAAGGHVDTLAWLFDSCGCACDGRAAVAAAHAGRIDVLKWLADRCDLDELAFCAAAAGGQLGTLDWLRRAGYQWDEMAAASAAYAGQLEVLQWLDLQGCPWDAWFCGLEAARGGRVGVLRWLRERGCPLTAQTFSHAARHGRLEAQEWLIANGCDRYQWQCGSIARRLAAFGGVGPFCGDMCLHGAKSLYDSIKYRDHARYTTQLCNMH